MTAPRSSGLGDADLARWRLRTQRLVAPHAEDARAVVTSLLAVQAENPSQSAWAVACRTEQSDRRDLAELLDEGSVLRTHVLRPTWHYVTADDIGWLLDLTGPRAGRITGQQLRTTFGLDASGVDRATAVVVDALTDRGSLVRADLTDTLVSHGFTAGGMFVMILVADLELRGLVCSAAPRDGEHTYALLADRVPNPRRLAREDALAELALRYFTGHGPATERDLAYWATLPVTDVRTGVEQVRDRLDCIEHEGKTYWFAGEPAYAAVGEPRGHLLQILDETYRGYQESRWLLDQAGIVPRVRETAAGMALVDGQLVASMRRTIGKAGVTFELGPYRPLADDEREALEQAAERYGAFLGLPHRLSVRERPADAGMPLSR